MRKSHVAAPVVLLCAGVLVAPGPSGAAAGRQSAPGRIVYSVGAVLPDPDLGAGSQIFTIKPDGRGNRQLTHVAAPAEAGDPSYSPSSTQIAYVSNVDGPFQVWVMQADGSGQHQLVTDPGHDAFVPRWSRDGHHLVFTRCLTSFGFVECTTATVGSDGGGLRDLTGGHWQDFAADYGPGQGVAFSSSRGGYESRILTVGSGPRVRAVTDPDIEAFWPDYSPDGTHILFGNNFGRPITQTYSMRANGSQVRQLSHIPDGGSAAFGRWSPDGRKIVFDRFDGVSRDWLAVMDSDGSQVRTLRETGNLTIADWGTPS